jgi:hypothetical protein
MPTANVKSFENCFHSVQQQNGVPLRYETRQGGGLLVLLCLGQSAAPLQDQGRVVSKVHGSHVEFPAQAHELLTDTRELELLGQEEKLFPYGVQGNLEGIWAIHPQSTQRDCVCGRTVMCRDGFGQKFAFLCGVSLPKRLPRLRREHVQITQQGRTVSATDVGIAGHLATSWPRHIAI